MIGTIMATCEIAVMFDENEMALIRAHADNSNMTFSEFVRRSALEKAEDMADKEAYDEALDNDDGVRFPMDNVIHMATKAD